MGPVLMTKYALYITWLQNCTFEVDLESGYYNEQKDRTKSDNCTY